MVLAFFYYCAWSEFLPFIFSPSAGPSGKFNLLQPKNFALKKLRKNLRKLLRTKKKWPSRSKVRKRMRPKVLSRFRPRRKSRLSRGRSKRPRPLSPDLSFRKQRPGFFQDLLRPGRRSPKPDRRVRFRNPPNP